MGTEDVHIFALAAHGQGLSGSDRIFIEFARRWSKQLPVTIYVSLEGYRMCHRQHLDTRVKFRIIPAINYLARIIEGIRTGLTLKLENSQYSIIYSASEFWMDSIPAWILKLRFPKAKWVAAWFQTAPNPGRGFSEGTRENRYIFKALLYFLVQLPVKPLIANFADYVLVNNVLEQKQFNSLNVKERALVVSGAVDIESVEKWKTENRKLPKLYDAVFQGRFHPQKGVLEVIDIWRLVVDKEKSAKLVMIGDGSLMKDVQSKIKYLGLGQNIILTGYLFDGPKKYKIFAQSKLVLHPSFYDSGGMAAAEAMVFGLPCVGFDLDSYKSYYPKGMIKVTIGNLEKFANIVINLLNDQPTLNRIGKEGLDMINKNWSWDKRAGEILNEIYR